jgi:pimeloyl-ACP methyl ester carboxylesterase
MLKVKEVAHMLNLEKPDEVNQLLQNFLQTGKP